MPATLDALLASLETAKSRFGPRAAAWTKVLLDQLSGHSFRDAESLLRFHETLLFLRAFPQSRSLVSLIEQLPVSNRERAELYDSLRLPLRWHLDNLKLSRTRNWTRPRHFYFHTQALIARSQVALGHELSRPAPRFVTLRRRESEAIMHLI